jgi:hypothetical protein
MLDCNSESEVKKMVTYPEHQETSANLADDCLDSVSVVAIDLVRATNVVVVSAAVAACDFGGVVVIEFPASSFEIFYAGRRLTETHQTVDQKKGHHLEICSAGAVD